MQSVYQSDLFAMPHAVHLALCNSETKSEPRYNQKPSQVCFNKAQSVLVT